MELSQGQMGLVGEGRSVGGGDRLNAGQPPGQWQGEGAEGWVGQAVESPGATGVNGAYVGDTAEGSGVAREALVLRPGQRSSGTRHVARVATGDDVANRRAELAGPAALSVDVHVRVPSPSATSSPTHVHVAVSPSAQRQSRFAASPQEQHVHHPAEIKAPARDVQHTVHSPQTSISTLSPNINLAQARLAARGGVLTREVQPRGARPNLVLGGLSSPSSAYSAAYQHPPRALHAPPSDYALGPSIESSQSTALNKHVSALNQQAEAVQQSHGLSKQALQPHARQYNDPQSTQQTRLLSSPSQSSPSMSSFAATPQTHRNKQPTSQAPHPRPKMSHSPNTAHSTPITPAPSNPRTNNQHHYPQHPSRHEYPMQHNGNLYNSNQYNSSKYNSNQYNGSQCNSSPLVQSAQTASQFTPQRSPSANQPGSAQLAVTTPLTSPGGVSYDAQSSPHTPVYASHVSQRGGSTQHAQHAYWPSPISQRVQSARGSSGLHVEHSGTSIHDVRAAEVAAQIVDASTPGSATTTATPVASSARGLGEARGTVGKVPDDVLMTPQTSVLGGPDGMSVEYWGGSTRAWESPEVWVNRNNIDYCMSIPASSPRD